MTPCFESEKEALYPKGLRKAFLGGLMFYAVENAVISVYLNQEEAGLFLQYILGLMCEKRGAILIRKTNKTTTYPP